jgi:hypothetical protein
VLGLPVSVGCASGAAGTTQVALGSEDAAGRHAVASPVWANLMPPPQMARSGQAQTSPVRTPQAAAAAREERLSLRGQPGHEECRRPAELPFATPNPNSDGDPPTTVYEPAASIVYGPMPITSAPSYSTLPAELSLVMVPLAISTFSVLTVRLVSLAATLAGPPRFPSCFDQGI